MTGPMDPRRLIDSDDADPELRRALRVIRDDAPSISALALLADGAERALREGAAASGGATAAASTPLALKVVLALAGGGVVALLGVGAAHLPAAEKEPAARQGPPVTTPVGMERSPSPGATPAAPALAPAPPMQQRAPAIPATPMVASGLPEVAPDAPSALPSPAAFPATSPAAAGDGPGRNPETPAGAPSRPTASKHEVSEMDLLEGAQEALGSDARGALQLLARHRNAYPRGKFAQERDVLALEAFKRLHDRRALVAGARAFLERYPRSPHRARVNQLLGEPQ